MAEDYDALLDEAKSLTPRIQSLDKIINTAKAKLLEDIEVTLTSTQLQPFIDKRAELKTRKDEICDLVKAL